MSQSSTVKVLKRINEVRLAFAVKRMTTATTDSVTVYHIAIRTAGDLSSSVIRGITAHAMHTSWTREDRVETESMSRTHVGTEDRCIRSR